VYSGHSSKASHGRSPFPIRELVWIAKVIFSHSACQGSRYKNTKWRKSPSSCPLHYIANTLKLGLYVGSKHRCFNLRRTKVCIRDHLRMFMFVGFSTELEPHPNLLIAKTHFNTGCLEVLRLLWFWSLPILPSLELNEPSRWFTALLLLLILPSGLVEWNPAARVAIIILVVFAIWIPLGVSIEYRFVQRGEEAFSLHLRIGINY